MKTDILLAGVGGQGILSIAAILGAAALNENLFLKQAETHGMSQRGGAVVSHLRISDNPIYSDLIPLGSADLILAVEPMESLRYLPYLAKTGGLVTNTTRFKNIAKYPDIDAEFKLLEKKLKVIQIDADKIAYDTGNRRASNMVMLGAASPFINIPAEIILNAIETVFSKKGKEVIESNQQAFRAGRAFAEQAGKK
ncbi:MAG: indolepyruvate oxidoreductase [Draconibacterium sp.]|nr:MAG: indolepyruvate oxidoreductase [Draconibacterium sp.]